MEKTLLLKCEKRVYKDKETQEQKEFNAYFVEVNGVPVRVSPVKGDLTGIQLLNKYFASK